MPLTARHEARQKEGLSPYPERGPEIAFGETRREASAYALPLQGAVSMKFLRFLSTTALQRWVKLVVVLCHVLPSRAGLGWGRASGAGTGEKDSRSGAGCLRVFRCLDAEADRRGAGREVARRRLRDVADHRRGRRQAPGAATVVQRPVVQVALHHRGARRLGCSPPAHARSAFAARSESRLREVSHTIHRPCFKLM